MFKFSVALVIVLLFLPSQTFARNDSGFIAGRDFNYYSATRQFFDIADSAVSFARVRLAGILRDSIDYRPDIYIEDNLNDFKERIGASVPDWGAAVAMPYKRMIVVKSPAHFRLGKSLYELLLHEYAHLALENRLNHVRPPRWLDEGLAMYTSYEWGWAGNITLSQAVVLGNLVPLRDIENLNRFSGGKAQLAYAQSYMAVRFLLDAYGVESFNILLDSLKSRRSVDEALMAATGSDYSGFEREYVDFLKSRFNLLTIIANMSYLWLFLAVVVVVGFILAFRKKKKYYKKWEEEEKYQSTDFDYGDPDSPEKADDEDKPWL